VKSVRSMRIGDKWIGDGSPAYIIAEIGVNHDGDEGRALELIDAAAKAGADAVKFQYFHAEMLMSGGGRLAQYQVGAGETSPIEMLRRLELSEDSLRACVKRAKSRNVHAIVSVFSLPLVSFVVDQGWDAVKTASPDIVHRPLLEALWKTGLPMIVSTGASTLEEVARAIGWLPGALDGERLALLQCVSSYPTAQEHAELGGIRALEQALPVVIGYSDHTKERETGALAVAHGASILEKHFTSDTSLKGPDHAASLDPSGLAEYVMRAKAQTRGSLEHAFAGPESLKRVLAIEQDVRQVSRQSVVLQSRKKAGEKIVAADICFKRPGNGIPPFAVEGVIGRYAARDIAADVPLLAEDLVDFQQLPLNTA